jgi:hypothetical protein
MSASPTEYGLVLFLLLAAGSTGMDDVPSVFVPNQFWICSENFESHAGLSVYQCKSLCLAQAGCQEFSYPLDDAPSGCRIAKQGGCEARPYDNELYSVYKKQAAPTDEPPDMEGPGARRRRRTDSRRRTHSPAKTTHSDENMELRAKKTDAEKAQAEADAARIQGENDSILYMKEHKAKAEVEKLQLDWKIKQHILDQPKTDKKEETAVKKEETAETAGKTDLESQVKALKSSEKVMTANIRNAENSIETTESQKLGVLQKISLAKASIEQLMNDPGKLADQDRQIGIAILGKLRVAKALINGDIVSLKHEQTKVPWVVRLREATEKALRHPSK